MSLSVFVGKEKFLKIESFSIHRELSFGNKLQSVEPRIDGDIFT